MMSREDDMRMLQIRIMFLFQRRYNINDAVFEEMDNKYAILDFLEYEYERLHLEGDEGILIDLVAMLREKGCALV